MSDSTTFRERLGLAAVLGSMIAFGGLYFIEIPARNENALMFAMGVIFGWGSAVFASEYGSSNIGRKVAEGAVEQMKHQSGGPSGAPDDPQHVEVTNVPDNPVPIADANPPKPKGRSGG